MSKWTRLFCLKLKKFRKNLEKIVTKCWKNVEKIRYLIVRFQFERNLKIQKKWVNGLGFFSKCVSSLTNKQTKKLKSKDFEEKKFIVRFSGEKSSEKQWKLEKNRKRKKKKKKKKNGPGRSRQNAGHKCDLFFRGLKVPLGGVPWGGKNEVFLQKKRE